MNIQSLVTIGITTRNRFDDMEKTLSKLIDLELNTLPLIIYDDASEDPVASEEVLSKFDKLIVVRNIDSKGLVVNRNRIVEMAKTPYIVSLDDDSCFSTIPPLNKAIEYLEKNLMVVALEFKNIDINSQSQQAQTLFSASKIHAVKSYTGCGHMIRRSTFLELGGYREFFHYMSEESDFAQRAWGKDYEIHLFSDIEVHHRRTPVARIPAKSAFYNARNISLCNLLNKPFAFALLRIICLYPILIIKNLRYPSLVWQVSIGWLNALLFIFMNFNQRTPMSISRYFSYQQLPSGR